MPGSIDTDGIRDPCSECGSQFSRSVKLVGGWVIDCVGCDNTMPWMKKTEHMASIAWNKQERENGSPDQV